MSNNKEENKPNMVEGFVGAVNASAGHNASGTEDLLSAMSTLGDKPATPEAKRPYRVRWQRILAACCCILAIAAAAKAYLYLDTKTGAVVKELDAVEARTAITTTKEQLAAVAAEIKELKAANTQLRAELKEIRDALDALRARKNSVVPAHPRRR